VSVWVDPDPFLRQHGCDLLSLPLLSDAAEAVMELILIIILLILLFGGGFGYYRGGYYSRGGGYGVGILGATLIVVLIVWLLRGHLDAV
jgi:hypothetical protein